MPGEVWTDIPEYEGLYQLSDKDRVRSLTRHIVDTLGHEYTLPGRLKKLTRSDSGYLVVILHKKGKARTFCLHSLKLLTYVGPCPEGMEARHLDGDSSNNRLENLEWSSHQDNINDKYDHGTMTSNLLGNSHKLKGNIDKVLELFSSGKSTLEIAREYGVTQRAIQYHVKNYLDKIPRTRTLIKGV